MDSEESARISIERFAAQLRKPEAVLFWQYLDDNPGQKQMLAGLYQAGCDPLTLMTLAVLYCKGGELGVTETAKQATGYSALQLASFPSACCKPQRTFRRSTKPRCGAVPLFGS